MLALLAALWAYAPALRERGATMLAGSTVAVCFSGWQGRAVPDGGESIRRYLVRPLKADVLLALRMVKQVVPNARCVVPNAPLLAADRQRCQSPVPKVPAVARASARA